MAMHLPLDEEEEEKAMPRPGDTREERAPTPCPSLRRLALGLPPPLSLCLCLTLATLCHVDRSWALAPPPNQPSCDFTNGTWMYAPKKLPRYTGDSSKSNYCKYMRSLWNCAQHRPDSRFAQYKWQPFQCAFKLFRPSTFGAMLRGKRMAMFGDSIMVNTFEAMVCLLSQSAVTVTKLPARTFEGSRTFKGFRFEEFNFELYYLFTPYLAKANKNSTASRGGHGYFVECDKVDSTIEKTLHNFDIVLFGTGVWWMQQVPGRTQPNTYLVNGEPLDIADLDAQAMALTTVREFVRSSDYGGLPYFMSISPRHPRENKGSEGACGASQPLNDLRGSWRKLTSVYMKYFSRQRSILDSPESPIRFLPITPIARSRPDGHMGLWIPGGKDVSSSQSIVPSTGDCTHWCLPGVPDNYVDMLFNYLLLEPSLQISSS